MQRNGLEPLLFTTSVINWKQRQDLEVGMSLSSLLTLETNQQQSSRQQGKVRSQRVS